MSMDASSKQVRCGARSARPIEMAVLREAFDGCLPDGILWRQKEQFSDGIGCGWIDGLRAHADSIVGDAEFAAAAKRFPLNPPQTKEAYWYRALFDRHFPGAACAATVPGGRSIACSSPAAIAWDAVFAQAADPSGRAVAGVHLRADVHATTDRNPGVPAPLTRGVASFSPAAARPGPESAAGAGP